MAIYRDELPVKPPNPSSPEYLASVFRKAGYGVTFLDSKALCVPEIFNRKNFDVFVHPYGSPFPVGTQLYQFLEGGGHLITLGGHPFRRALMFSPEGKLVDGGYDAGITTTVARQADYKLPFREQLGMFYTGFERFEDVAYVTPAPGQDVVRKPFKLNAHLEGEVAAALVGERLSLEEGERLAEEGTFPAYAHICPERASPIWREFSMELPGSANFNYLSGYIFNWPRARWIPLINAYDYGWDACGVPSSACWPISAGRIAGRDGSSAASKMKISSRLSTPSSREALLEALRYLGTGLGLHDALPEMDCYYQGETAKVAATVENYEPTPRQVAVDFQLIPSGAKSPAFEKRVEIDLAPGANARPSDRLEASAF